MSKNLYLAKQNAKNLCRVLRKNQTPEENIFWGHVRNRKFYNLKFTRQFPIFFKNNNTWRFYIADFYCHKYRLIIELDGRIHEYRKEYDQYRDTIINLLNYNMLRIPNEMIYQEKRLKIFLKTFLTIKFNFNQLK